MTTHLDQIIITDVDVVTALIGGCAKAGDEWILPEGKTLPSQEEIDAKRKELELAQPMRIMRRQRDQLLRETDVYMVSDHPTSKLAEWKTYRQQLRDMPENETPLLQPDGSLSNVTWPTKPE